MKSLVLLMAVVSVSAFADCKSAFVYQPFGSCRAAGNDVDSSTAEVVVPPPEAPVPIGPFDGGGNTNANSKCAEYARGLDRNDKDFAFRGEVVSAQDAGSNKDLLGHATYKFACRVQTLKFKWADQANKNCSLGNMQVVDASQSLQGVVGTPPVCLSCEDKRSADDRLACLSFNVERIIVPHAKDLLLRPQWLDAVSASISDMKDFEQDAGNVDATRMLKQLGAQVSQVKADLH